MAAKYGKTWWGEQWLEAFNGIDYSNRLPRGRSYAGNGSVRKIDVIGTGVEADVQGRRRTPYKVEVRLPAFSASAQKKIIATISQNPAVLARLLSRQLPEQTLALLEGQGIHVFPASWKDMNARCSCPDWAMPCKHIAAVIYLIANEIDKDPFLVFRLRAMDLPKAIEKASGLNLANLNNLPRVLDDWQAEPVIDNWFMPESPAFEQFDLTTIEPLGERIFSILSPQPLFHNKDFRQIMAGVYKRAARLAGSADKLLLCAAVPVKTRTKTDDAPADESGVDISVFDRLRLVVDEAGGFVAADTGGGADQPQNSLEWFALLSKLQVSQSPETSRHYHYALMWLQLYRLALKLVVEQAYVPGVYQDSGDFTLILQQPALLSEPVKSLLLPLYDLCPPDLVTLSHTPPRKKKAVEWFADGQTQVDIALHCLISHITGIALQQSPGDLATDGISRMFFAGKSSRFNQFENKQYPRVMRDWLHRLYLGERQHRLYLVVQEMGDALSVDVQVEQKGQLTPLSDLLGNNRLSDVRMSALTDLALLADYLPDIERLYHQNADELLVYSLAEFTPVLLQTLPALQMLGIQLVLPKGLRNLAYPQLSLSLSGDDSGKPVSYLNLDQLLHFNWQVAVGDQRVSAEEFTELVKNASGLVKMLDQYVMLDNARLQGLLKKLSALPESLTRIELLRAGLTGELDGATVDLGDSARALFDQLLSSEPTPLPTGLNAQLRPYQQRGFEWLAQNARIGFGSLIADDMGLGKTLQVISFLLHQQVTGQLDKSRALVVAPTSLLTNWRKEIERFAPSLKAQIYHGSQRELNDSSHDIILTSYGLVRSDSTRLGKINWRTLVIDEAQNIKNPGSQQTKAIKKLKADIRIGMSGTPVENRLREYWSLFDFTNKTYLGSQKKFTEEFAAPIEKDRDQAALDKFRKLTGPFILRRLKTDKSIITDLPDKVESNCYSSLSKEQASLYQSTVDSIMAELNSAEEGIERKGIVFKLLNALKQICNSPAQFLNHQRAETGESGKLAAFVEIVREAMAAEEKVLVFTQYTTMGNLLMDSLQRELDLSVPFLHGGLSRKKRDDLVDKFQNDVRTRGMILSLKAGGTGLNLTAASQVIHYDLWWNPAVEAQATDRAYRIGQKRNVQVHRLITENTFEEKIDAMIQSKKELADLTVASGEQWLTELSNDELKALVAL